jgi:signal peptidase I
MIGSGRHSRQLGALALVSVVAAAAALQSGIESVSVPDGAMAPSLLPGQHVLVQRLDSAADAGRGDVVVIRAPGAPGTLYMKRLIGGPGDVVLVSDGRAVKAPEGHYFALSDNRVGSFDSHQGWFVAADDLVGRVMVSYWPPAAAGPIVAHPGPEAVAAPELARSRAAGS